MMSLTTKLFDFSIPLLDHFGYWIILFAAIFESSPLFGLLIPGQFLVIVGGILVKADVLKFWGVVFVAAFGAIIGDLIGYYLGKKYGYSFISSYGKYFFFKKKYFEKTKKLMNNHIGKALIIGRFNSLTRAFAPFVAGSSKVSFPKFLTYNIIGGVSWALCFVMVGYFFGASYELISKYIGRFILGAIIISVVLIYTYRFINKRKYIFTKQNAYTLILNILSLYIFSKMVEDVIDSEIIVRVDVWINSNIIALWNSVLTKLMLLITTIGGSLVLVSLSIILLGILIYKKKWHSSLLLLFSMLGGLALELLLKIIVHRARPQNALIDVAGYSFPSGHATMSIIFFSLVIYIFNNEIKNIVLKYIFIIVNILLFLAIGFSRIYLKVHWFSDVIAGFALGLFWLTLLILIFKAVSNFSKKPLIVELFKRKNF